MQIIDRDNWGNHPFLSRLNLNHDFDGWYLYFNINHPNEADNQFAKKVAIEYSLNGREWVRTFFVEKQPFITWVSSAWDYSGPMEEASDGEIYWRAVIEGAE